MATIHTPFFGNFPKELYDINKGRIERKEEVTNIFFRVGILQNILNNISAYETYELEDGDTPEIVAERMYGDSGAGWIILYANKIVDPQFDWPLNLDEFDKYIINKYGSVEYAQSNIMHVEKTITRTNETEGTENVQTYIITPKRFTDNRPTVPFDYYVWQQDLSLVPPEVVPFVSGDSTLLYADNFTTDMTVDLDIIRTDGGLAQRSFNRKIVIDGDVVSEYIEAKPISYYDYEDKRNQDKKNIKVIKAVYYNRIMNEFINLTGNGLSSTGMRM